MSPISFLTIANSLHTSGEIAVEFLRDEYGISPIKVEESIERGLNYIPTIWGKNRDFYYICVDIAESLISNARMQFVDECIKRSLPVKLFVAIEQQNDYNGLKSDLVHIREKGIGFIEIDTSSRTARIIQSAVSFSLVGLRLADKKKFPAKYREKIHNAEQTYLSGDPNKGVGNIMDLIEDVTRKISLKSLSLNLWTNPIPTPQQVTKMPWAALLKQMETQLDRSATSICHWLNDPLIARVRGFTDQRNESAHVPKNRTELLSRDRTLRTRMEYATDTLREILKSARALRI